MVCDWFSLQKEVPLEMLLSLVCVSGHSDCADNVNNDCCDYDRQNCIVDCVEWTTKFDNGACVNNKFNDGASGQQWESHPTMCVWQVHLQCVASEWWKWDTVCDWFLLQKEVPMEMLLLLVCVLGHSACTDDINDDCCDCDSNSNFNQRKVVMTTLKC